VVDDDAPQLDMLVEMLRKLGYAATGARSGEAALDLVGRQGVRYDLVILDMVLTLGMDGLKAFSELRKLVPDQKVLLVSGFTRASRTVTLAQQQGAGAYLRKPLTAEQVARAVRRELDGPRAEAERAGPRRVLIVDNEHLIRRLFGLIVTSEFPGVAVDQASNGLEAIESFRVHRQDVLILDLQMPVVDGREAFQGIEQICQRNGWRVPPVIFCTGYAAPESLASIVADGSYHRLLRKPVRAENLVQAIRERLEE
jgi:CheY-like chemotaxis protein